MEHNSIIYTDTPTHADVEEVRRGSKILVCLFPIPPHILNESHAKIWAGNLLDALGAESAIEQSIYILLIAKGRSIQSVIEDFKSHWKRAGDYMDLLNSMENTILN